MQAFTTTGDRTIEFIDRRLQFLAVLADYAEHLTFYDVLDITEAYNCAGVFSKLQSETGLIQELCNSDVEIAISYVM